MKLIKRFTWYEPGLGRAELTFNLDGTVRGMWLILDVDGVLR